MRIFANIPTPNMRTLLLLTFLFVASSASAQVNDSLVIELKNGEIVKIPFSDLSYISFETKAGVADHHAKSPATLAYPNPANAAVTIAFSLESAQMVSIEIADVGGRSVRTIERRCDKGKQEIIWDGMLDDGRMAPAGTYIYHIAADGMSLSGKLTIRR